MLCERCNIRRRETKHRYLGILDANVAELVYPVEICFLCGEKHGGARSSDGEK